MTLDSTVRGPARKLQWTPTGVGCVIEVADLARVELDARTSPLSGRQRIR
jgi:hypothetical protein